MCQRRRWRDLRAVIVSSRIHLRACVSQYKQDFRVRWRKSGVCQPPFFFLLLLLSSLISNNRISVLLLFHFRWAELFCLTLSNRVYIDISFATGLSSFIHPTLFFLASRLTQQTNAGRGEVKERKKKKRVTTRADEIHRRMPMEKRSAKEQYSNRMGGMFALACRINTP